MRSLFSTGSSRIVYGIQNYGKPISEERIRQIATIISFSPEFDANFFSPAFYQAIFGIRGRKGKISLNDKINYEIEEGLSFGHLKKEESGIIVRA